MNGNNCQRGKADGDDGVYGEFRPVFAPNVEPSMWRSTSTPFSYFSQIIFGISL